MKGGLIKILGRATRLKADINRAISAIRQTENTNKFFKPMKIKQVSEHALSRFGGMFTEPKGQGTTSLH